jgi:hypothetical protein
MPLPETPKEKKMKPRHALLPAALFLALFTGMSSAAGGGPPSEVVWAYAKIDVNVTLKGDNHQFRVYVTNLVSMTSDQWEKTVTLHEKKNVSDYFDATVVKAAKSRGEELSYYDQDVDWDCTCVGSTQALRPKSDVETNRNDVIETAKSNGHPVVFFNWDPTGKNLDQDLQSEMKKSNAPSR